MHSDIIVIEGNTSEITGEVIMPDGDPIEVANSLATVGNAILRADILRLQMEERRQAVLAADEEYTELNRQLSEATYVVSSVEDMLGTLYTNEDRIKLGQGMSMTVGNVTVTFAKPAVRTNQAINATEILKRAKKSAEWAEIRDKLGITSNASDPKPPTITVKAPK